MFEDDQDAVETLLADNDRFKQLYDKHQQLKKRVHDAEDGALPMDDATLGTLKKEKLRIKDEMAEMICEYRNTVA